MAHLCSKCFRAAGRAHQHPLHLEQQSLIVAWQLRSSSVSLGPLVLHQEQEQAAGTPATECTQPRQRYGSPRAATTRLSSMLHCIPGARHGAYPQELPAPLPCTGCIISQAADSSTESIVPPSTSEVTRTLKGITLLKGLHRTSDTNMEGGYTVQILATKPSTRSSCLQSEQPRVRLAITVQRGLATRMPPGVQ
jgi:hypothetical protein